VDVPCPEVLATPTLCDCRHDQLAECGAADAVEQLHLDHITVEMTVALAHVACERHCLDLCDTLNLRACSDIFGSELPQLPILNEVIQGMVSCTPPLTWRHTMVELE
jgi:hypothetical protein